jgi:hypothetical protein
MRLALQPSCFCNVSSAKLLRKAFVIPAQLFSKTNIICKVCEDPTQPGYLKIFSAESRLYALCYMRSVLQLFGSQAACKSVYNDSLVVTKFATSLCFSWILMLKTLGYSHAVPVTIEQIGYLHCIVKLK